LKEDFLDRQDEEQVKEEVLVGELKYTIALLESRCNSIPGLEGSGIRKGAGLMSLKTLHGL
jgi:hypothetical protein